jgi:hypothetical protein
MYIFDILAIESAVKKTLKTLKLERLKKSQSAVIKNEQRR